MGWEALGDTFVPSWPCPLSPLCWEWTICLFFPTTVAFALLPVPFFPQIPGVPCPWGAVSASPAEDVPWSVASCPVTSPSSAGSHVSLVPLLLLLRSSSPAAAARSRILARDPQPPPVTPVSFPHARCPVSSHPVSPGLSVFAWRVLRNRLWTQWPLRAQRPLLVLHPLLLHLHPVGLIEEV